MLVEVNIKVFINTSEDTLPDLTKVAIEEQFRTIMEHRAQSGLNFLDVVMNAHSPGSVISRVLVDIPRDIEIEARPAGSAEAAGPYLAALQYYEREGTIAERFMACRAKVHDREVTRPEASPWHGRITHWFLTNGWGDFEARFPDGSVMHTWDGNDTLGPKPA